jgi:hypothetical protein
MGIFRYGGMGHDEAVRNLELFADQVLPEVRKLSPAPMSLTAA